MNLLRLHSNDCLCYNQNMKNEKSKFNWPLVGNGQIIDFLGKIIDNSRKNEAIANGAYIFSGQKDLGKATIANYFAQSLLCRERQNVKSVLPCGVCPACSQFMAGSSQENKTDNVGNIHSDLTVLKKEADKKNITIEQVRELIRHLNMSSFFNSYKIGIIREAETLSEEAANALLKTLEEPKNKVVIILLANDVESLPETIISRCQVLRFYPVAPDTIYDYLVSDCKTSRSMAKNFSHLSLGRPALAIKFFQDKDFYENYLEIAKNFLQLMREDLNNRFSIVELAAGKKASGQNLVGGALATLEIWQAMVRDMLLLLNNQNDIIQHINLQAELNYAKNRFKTGDLINLLRVFETARKQIVANVNPRLALENAAINI